MLNLRITCDICKEVNPPKEDDDEVVDWVACEFT